MAYSEKHYKEITDAFGVPGFEGEIRKVLTTHLEGLADEITTDNLGSIIAKKTGVNPDRSILFIAHMDECGFMVKQITKEGYIKFLPLGGWHAPVVLGQRVMIQTLKGPVLGVVGAKAPHGMKEEEKNKPLNLDDFWIDTGVTSDFNPCKEIPIRPGDPIVPYGAFEKTPNPDVLIARNWDNRVGCAVLLNIFAKLKDTMPPCTIYGAFAVQEELGLRGAATVPWMVNPDLAIALDVSLGEDTPADNGNSDAKLGAGPAIVVHDRSMVPHLKLRDTLASLAEQHSIPHHFTTVPGGYDTGRVHQHKHGVPSAVLGIPSRYIHGFASMIHQKDVENTTRLALKLVSAATPKMIDDLKMF